MLGGELLAVSGHMRFFASALRNKAGTVPAINQRAALWVIVRSSRLLMLCLFVTR
jgi:hypothetical protein